MSRKLIVSILIVSFALLELLAVRQEQLNTVHEMSRLHSAINNGGEHIASISIEIEMACSPSKLYETIAVVESGEEH